GMKMENPSQTLSLQHQGPCHIFRWSPTMPTSSKATQSASTAAPYLPPRSFSSAMGSGSIRMNMCLMRAWMRV
ncbi:hypothetical protein NDU88_003289, partial [Pleurodeles waltl]